MGGFYVVRVDGLALVPSAAVLGGPPSPANGWGLDSPLAARIDAGGMNAPHTIVDSGTSFTYVPSAAFNALKNAIAAFCSGGGGRCAGTLVAVPNESVCYRLPGGAAALATFPALIIELQGGVVVDVAPEHLFINMDWDRYGAVRGARVPALR